MKFNKALLKRLALRTGIVGGMGGAGYLGHRLGWLKNC